MGELTFLLRKAALEKEKQENEWRVTQLETTVIPHLQHELATVKRLGLDCLSTEYTLNSVLREYKHLTGRQYQF